MADLLLHTDFPKEALQHLVSAEQIDFEIPDLHFAKAKAHRDLRQLEEAIEEMVLAYWTINLLRYQPYNVRLGESITSRSGAE